ncbi:copper transporter [Actinotalea sp. AC32]|nr:copper transporter [Actinotalea sp. AC32]
MIDFRYHLVSLISVFLALAVGIALGAGPLKESIGDTLTGQVDQLRTERAELRADLETTQADLVRAGDALDAVADDLLADVLGDRRVAIVQIGEVEPEVRDAVMARLEQADGSVSAVVQVTDAWTDPERLAFRQSLAGQLVEYLEPRPADDAGTGTELAEALAQALTTARPEDPDALSESASIALELLREGELVTVEGEVGAPADAVVVLAGPAVDAVDAQDEEQRLESAAPEVAEEEAERVDALLGAASQISVAVQQRSAGAVVAGGDLVEPSLVQRIRETDASARTVSTVESVQRVSGQVAVPLALAARISGTVGHYGSSEGADAVMPDRVVLEPVQRTVEVPETPADGAPADGAPADGAPADGTDGDATTGEG